MSAACDTAAGSIEHPDESIVMAAAMHVVGFEQVIGTCGIFRTALVRVSPIVSTARCPLRTAARTWGALLARCTP